MQPRDTKQVEFIKTNFRTVWSVHLTGFTRLLVQLRQRFDGDLDLALVLAVIGSRTRLDRWSSELEDHGQMTSSDPSDSTQHPINIQSVADYSGIPRETVRRKVAILQEKGWVSRSPDGRLAVAKDAASDLEDSTADTIAYLGALLTAFEAARDGIAENERG